MIHLETETLNFVQTVDEWVEVAMRSRPQSFSTLVSALPGVYPEVVMNSLMRLVACGVVPKESARLLLKDAMKGGIKSNVGFQDQLPVPHPLDFDWRFTPTATQAISCISQSLGRRIACIGTPSVFANLSESQSSGSCQFFDRNEASVDYFRSIGLVNSYRLDCFQDTPPDVNFEVIVMDPPWYENDYRAFMWMAAQMVDPNGFVIVVFPPFGTRPSVALERQRLIDWGSQLGMGLVQILESCIAYVTPHFEVNSLRSAGINCEIGTWRRGTLAVFQMQQRRRTSRPASNSSCEWDEAVYLGTRFRFRRTGVFGSVDLRLESIIKGDVLGSVSRTDPNRSVVDVWTSGNRVFRCRGPTKLYDLFTRFISSMNCVKVRVAAENNCFELEAVRHLAYLARLEKFERDGKSLSQNLAS